MTSALRDRRRRRAAPAPTSGTPASGDALADASALYEEYFPLIYRYFARRVAGPEVAEDLTSATFERVVGALPRFTPGQHGRVSTRVWVYRIASNIYKNQLRAAERERKYVTAWAEGRRALPAPAADEALVVHQALSSLAPEDRDILGLRFWESLTAREIAAVVGCSQREVYTALERCLRELRRSLGADPARLQAAS